MDIAELVSKGAIIFLQAHVYASMCEYDWLLP